MKTLLPELLILLSSGALLFAAGPPVSDDFNTPSLNSTLWTSVNPVGDGSFSLTGTQLKLNVPAGPNHDPAFGGADNSVRVVQSIANADLLVTVKFDSIPTLQFQFQGIVVEQDSANYLRFQFGSDASTLHVSGSQIVSQNETTVVDNVITLPGGTTGVWLKIQRSGNTWTETWSTNGTVFNAAGSFTFALTAADIGPFAGNYGSTSAPAFAAIVDSFISGSSAGVPDLTIIKSHAGNFTFGQAGASYTLTATNSGTAATSGQVSVSDTLPSGLTATSIAGTGWTCTQPAGPCTRSDVLAASAAYPALTLTVNVAGNAPVSITNTATVSGGGETNTSNDTASDATTIGTAAGPPVTDNFNTSSLNTSLWTFLNPVGDGSFSMTGTQLKVNVPAGPNHDAAFNGVDSSPRVVQTIANADFTVTVKFDSIPSQQYQFQGMVVDQDAANYLRFQFGSGGNFFAFAADKILAHSETSLFSNTITLPGGTTSLWLRAQRVANAWTVSWSPDGNTFTVGGTFTQALTVADIGLFAGNYGTTSAPAFSTLIDSFVSGTVAPVPDLTISKSHTGNFTLGQTGARYTITATNSGNAPTSGTVTVTDTLPAGLTATNIAGTGWTCTQPGGSCTRNDVLAAGASYPALTLTVNVANTAPATVTNTAAVSGGGETTTSNDTASDPTAIGAAAVPDLTIAKSHTGNFTLGQTGATYSITATNSGNAPTSGTVTVTDTVPAGLTATSIAGTGWTCTQPAGSCTRTDVLAGGASYPALTLTVNVSNTAPATVTNTATVSGGGEATTSNDTASDATTIGTAAGPPVTDNFNTSSLNTSLWTFQNPVGDGSFSMTGTQLKLNVPAGPNHDAAFNGVDSSPRVVQTIANADFTVTVKFDSIPSQQYQFQGMVVDQDAANYLRFQFGSGGNFLAFAADKILAHSETSLFSNTITLPGGTTSLWLRAQRAANAWTVSWSPDGNTFTVGGTFTQVLTVADIGLFAGNYGTTSAPAFSTLIDSSVSGTVAAVPDLTISKSHAGNFTLGQTGARYTITATNSGNAPTSGTVTVTDTLPAGLTATNIAGTGWTCTQPGGSCTRNDVLAAGASYPALTLTINVANTAPATVTNTAAVSGGGETNTSNDTASDPTAMGAAAVPDLTIAKSHAGNFTLGQTGATYSITATNSGNAPTSGTVTVTDTVPAGLTATSIAGTGWTCTQPAGSCTRSDALAAGASYPTLTLTVNVSNTAPATVTNTATVSGGGEATTSNDTASDATTIGTAAGPPVTDNFNTSSLNTSLWTFQNPVGDGSFSMTGTQLKLNVPAGPNHDPAFGGTNSSVRVVQSIANGDFLVTVKFDSIPTQQYQAEGVLADQDTANYLRFQFGSDGSTLHVGGSQIQSHNETTVLDKVITLPGGTTSIWLRIQRSGNTWTETWSPDGASFTSAGSFNLALTASDIGIFAANYGDVSAPAFSALMDSFVSGSVAPVPVLTITKSHTGNFTPGQTGALYALKVTNSGTSPTSGTVTVTDTVPSGLTATSIAGSGWTCTQPAGPCTRNGVLAAAASFPPLTLTVNVANNAPGTVTNTAAVTGGGATNTNNSASDPATVGVSADPVSDDFRNITLNTGLWTFIDPLGGSYSLTGTNLLINVQGGVSHDPLASAGNYSSRAMQSVHNVDFSAEIKFDSIPTQTGTVEGILVEQDASNFLRFEFQGAGGGTSVFAGKVIGGAPSTISAGTITTGSSLWMRVARTGNSWTLTWSGDGANFQSAASFSQSLTVSAIGPMAGNFGNSGRETPDFTASVDYFFNRASPIVPQDGGLPRISNVTSIPGAASAAITWNTDESATSRVDYGLTTSYGGTRSDQSLVSAHSVLLTGLTCAATYNFAVTSGDGAGATRQSSNFTFATPPCAQPSAPRSDSFDVTSLNTAVWTWIDPNKDSNLAFNGTTAQITVASEAVHSALSSQGNASARVVQPVLDANFDVAAKFVSNVHWGTTGQGIVVEQDALNYLLFELRSDGTTTSIWAASRAGAAQNVLLNTPFQGSAPIWLRVARSGSAWTVSWSKDGNNYTPAGSFQQSIVAASLGLYAANNGSTLLGTPAFTASVDAFVNINAPLPNNPAPAPFARIVIDPNPGTVLVQETMGDLDGDGRPDAIVGFSDQNHGIAWYRSPHSGTLTDKWDRFTITPSGESYEDVIVWDVNGDGAKDVIASIDSAIRWYENPAGHGGDPTTAVWQVHTVTSNAPGENNFILKDIDGDGIVDLVTPHTIYLGTGADFGQAVEYNNGGFRGLALIDVGSGKGAINLVGTDSNAPFNFVWFENPRETGGNARTGQWIEHVIGSAYPCTDPPSCFGGGSVANMTTGDMNGNGRMDVVTVQSEGYPILPPGGLIWFEAPADRRNGTWIKHTVDPGFDSPHNVWVADIDKNGTLDIVAAQQEQSKDRRIAIFFNDGTGNFSTQILSNTGSHNPFLIDTDGDGWLDLFSAGHGRFGAPNPVELYINPRGGSPQP